MIVEEHQDVLPYWFEKADKEGIRGATLLHIDAHNDMGEPGPPAVWDTAWPRAPFDKQRLFAANDEFIVFAALRGLIDRVVWLRPEYTLKHSRRRFTGTYHQVGFVDVGLLKKSRGRKRSACSCQFLRPLLPHRHRMKKPDCENADGDDIKYSDCEMVKRIRYEEITPSAALQTGLFGSDLFETSVAGKSAEDFPGPEPTPRSKGTKPAIILDIDEDYFGTENPAGNLKQAGWSKRRAGKLSKAVRRHFCVRDARAEAAVNAALSQAVAAAIKDKDEPVLSLGSQDPADVMCKGKSWEDGVAAVAQVARVAVGGSSSDREEMRQSLLQYGFCVQPEAFAKASIAGTLEKRGVPMTLCIGNSSPDEKSGSRVVFHTPTEAELREMAAVVRRLLRQIRYPIWLTTICRSSRDGYTPRSLQVNIEDQIRGMIDKLGERMESTAVTYDPDLYVPARA